jgi:hypothetical protein
MQDRSMQDLDMFQGLPDQGVEGRGESEAPARAETRTAAKPTAIRCEC